MAIQAVQTTWPASTADLARGVAGPATSGSFTDSLREAASELELLGTDAQHKVRDLVSGAGGEVHEAMIAVEKADLSFQLMLQVRNKVVQAYQQIANMQF